MKITMKTQKTLVRIYVKLESPNIHYAIKDFITPKREAPQRSIAARA